MSALKTEIDLSGFNQGMAALSVRLGIESRVVIRKEVGELVKYLVKYTPAADAKKIKENTLRKFNAIGDENNSNISWLTTSQQGKTGIKWFSVTPKYLMGVADKADMTKASVDELKKLSYKISKKGHSLNVPLKGKKGQRAIIYQTIVTKASTVKKLIAAKIKNKGRLKAGWMAAVFGGSIKIDGANMPPDYVTRHRSGVAGYFIDGTQSAGETPSYTIANTAAGVLNKKNKLDWVVKKALDIRVKSMETNLRMFLNKRKNLADYAK